MATLFDGLPKGIRVGGLIWKVKVVEKIDNGGSWGECDSGNLTLTFESDHLKNSALALDTVLHEINHAIFKNFHLADGDNEERICAVFATAWRQVAHANPRLMTWITKRAKNAK